MTDADVAWEKRIEMKKIQDSLWKKHIKIQEKYLSAMHTELGKLYGIPDCCIKQFVKEQKYGIQSAYFRQVKHEMTIDVGYVPCDECMKKMII